MLDLADLATVMPNVYYRQEDMLAYINRFYEEMLARSEEMKQHPGIKRDKTMLLLICPQNFSHFLMVCCFYGHARSRKP